MGAAVRQRPVPPADTVASGCPRACPDGRCPRGSRPADTHSADTSKKKRRLILECDELWSFVGSKCSRWWVWLALDAETRRVVAAFVGGRDERAARHLWDALPAEYRDGAVVRTDFLAAYAAVVPGSRHVPGGKGDGVTSHVERFWCTLRQRCSRFVRKSLSFSKCVHNHIGALWYFIRHYNASLP